MIIFVLHITSGTMGSLFSLSVFTKKKSEIFHSHQHQSRQNADYVSLTDKQSQQGYAVQAGSKNVNHKATEYQH